MTLGAFWHFWLSHIFDVGISVDANNDSGVDGMVADGRGFSVAIAVFVAVNLEIGVDVEHPIIPEALNKIASNMKIVCAVFDFI